MVKYHNTLNNPSCIHINTRDNRSGVTHVDLHWSVLLRSDHLEQLAIACTNIQELDLKNCFHCLERLQGLQAIASHCHNLNLHYLIFHHCTLVV